MPKPSIYVCPKCAGVGKPINVQSRAGSVVITLKCPYCQQGWSVTRPDTEVPKRRA